MVNRYTSEFLYVLPIDKKTQGFKLGHLLCLENGQLWMSMHGSFFSNLKARILVIDSTKGMQILEVASERIIAMVESPDSVFVAVGCDDGQVIHFLANSCFNFIIY